MQKWFKFFAFLKSSEKVHFKADLTFKIWWKFDGDIAKKLKFFYGHGVHSNHNSRNMNLIMWMELWIILFCNRRFIKSKWHCFLWASKLFSCFILFYIFCYLSFTKLKLTIPFCVLNIKLVHNFVAMEEISNPPDFLAITCS